MIQYGLSIIFTSVKMTMTWFRLRIYQKKRWNDTLEFRVTFHDCLTLNHLNLHNRPRSYAYLTRYWANHAKNHAKNWPIRHQQFFKKVIWGQQNLRVYRSLSIIQVEMCQTLIFVGSSEIWIFRNSLKFLDSNFWTWNSKFQSEIIILISGQC